MAENKLTVEALENIMRNNRKEEVAVAAENKLSVEALEDIMRNNRKEEVEVEWRSRREGVPVERRSRGEGLTVAKLERLSKNMEQLLWEVEQLRGVCGPRVTELVQEVVVLRREQRELTERLVAIETEMQELADAVNELTNAQRAFNAKERQDDKLTHVL